MKQFDPNNINGVIPAMITSFNKDESINKEGIRENIDKFSFANMNMRDVDGGCQGEQINVSK